ncbi:MAG: anti-sigma factor family protein [Candidatus Aminicenantales bacterium]
MSCRQAERWLLASFDRALPSLTGRALSEHLERCPECRKKAGEFALLRNRLAGERAPEPLPRFWERLESRMASGPALVPGAVLARLWAEAIPVSLSLIAGFLIASVFLLPSSSLSTDLSGAQALLLNEGNPIAETRAIIDEGQRDVRDLTLLFAGDETPPGRK